MKSCFTKEYYGYIVLSKKNASKVIELLGLEDRFSTKEEVQSFADKTKNEYIHQYCRYEKGKLIYGSIRHKVNCYDDYGSWNDWYYEDAFEKEIPCGSYLLFNIYSKKNPKFIRAMPKKEFEQQYIAEDIK